MTYQPAHTRRRYYVRRLVLLHTVRHLPDALDIGGMPDRAEPHNCDII